jgi:membrane protein required for colicin V production
MNWLDFVLLLILAASMVMAFRKGLTREIVGLAAVVLALVLGLWLYGSAGSLYEPYLRSPGLAHFAGFATVFGAVMLLGGAVNYVIGKFLKVTGLSIVDHLLGAGFGAVRGILISVALIMGIMAFFSGAHPPESVVRSRIAPYVVGGARVISSLAPHEIKDGFRHSYAQVEQAWGKAMANGIRSVPSADKEKNETEL